MEQVSDQLKERVFSDLVENGVSYLNGHNPGWLEKIDLERLDLGRNCNCILGQLYGHYSNAFWAGFGMCAHEGYGFKLHPAHGVHEYKMLTSIWKRKIQELRYKVS